MRQKAIRFLFIASAVLQQAICRAQYNTVSLRSAANDFYGKDKYDSALYCHMLQEQNDPAMDRAYLHWRKGECYLKMGNHKLAEQNLLQCLADSIGRRSAAVPQYYSCFLLYKIYYGRGRYREAIACLDSTKTKYRRRRGMCHSTAGLQEKNLDFNYQKSLCHYAMGLKDSAAKLLIPYIFWPTREVYFDSITYDRISQYFATTLFEVYGIPYVQRQMNGALANILYRLQYERYGDEKRLVVKAICTLNFMGIQVELNREPFFEDVVNGVMLEQLSLQAMVNGLKQSPAFRYIMNPDLLQNEML